MIKNWKITIAFLLATIVVSFISGNVKLDNPNIGEIIGGIFASVFILFFVPLIITYLLKLLSKWRKKDLKENEFVSTYAVAWGILTFLILYGSCSNKQYDSVDNSNSGYLYNPENSEYSVVFSKKPTITPTAVPIGSYFLNGEVAEVDLANFETFERVEFYILDKSYINIFDNDIISIFLKEYSRYNGLSFPEIKFVENGSNKYAELKAYKEATLNNGEKKALTFVARVFIKGETFFVTYVGADSKDFPTPDIIKFWNSIKNQP